MLEIFSKLDSGDIVDNIQQCNAGTCIVDGLYHLGIDKEANERGANLIGEPDAFGTALLLLVRVFLHPFEQEDEPVDRLARL